MGRPHPFVELLLGRFREFLREPEVVFWVFGFPILLALGLGLAFREQAPEVLPIGVLGGPGAAEVTRALAADPQLRALPVDAAEAARGLRMGKLALVVAPAPGAPPELRFDPGRPDSAMARLRTEAALQRAAGRRDPLVLGERRVSEPGARYIDFLIPGLLGMNIMSGGMWGVGYALVDMRVRKLLKRLVATPMRRTDFMGAIMASRMVMVIGEVLLLLLFGWLVFGLAVQGSIASTLFIALLGAFSFAALGMLVASRARKAETVSGLMNLVMLPMFVLSGVFFSSERFPDALQPAIRALPLTALNDALRATILEGAGLLDGPQLARLGVLAAWGVISFAIALRTFRWS